MGLRLNRAEVVGLFGIMHTNLGDSVMEVDRPSGEYDQLYVKITSKSAPGAERMYIIPPEGGPAIIKDDGYIPGLVTQTFDDDAA